MKVLAIILAWLAIGFILVQGWVGPIYMMYDGCTCGQRRVWLEFEESPSLRGKRLFLRIEKPGDLKHQHQFYDAQYGGHYPVLVFIGVGFGLSGGVMWYYRRKRASTDLSNDHVT